MKTLTIEISDPASIRALELIAMLRNKRDAASPPDDPCRYGNWTAEDVGRVWIASIANIVNKPEHPYSKNYMEANPNYDWDDLQEHVRAQRAAAEVNHGET